MIHGEWNSGSGGFSRVFCKNIVIYYDRYYLWDNDWDSCGLWLILLIGAVFRWIRGMIIELAFA